MTNKILKSIILIMVGKPAILFGYLCGIVYYGFLAGVGKCDEL